MTVAQPVSSMKSRQHFRACRDINFVTLAHISQIGRTIRLTAESIALEVGRALLFKFRKVRLQFFQKFGFQVVGVDLSAVEIVLHDRSHHGSRIIAHNIGTQNSKRRKSPRHHRHEDAWNSQSSRQRACVQGPGSSECDQRKRTRIITALN